MNRALSFLCIIVALCGAFAGGYYSGYEFSNLQKIEETNMFKEQVIDYLQDQGTLLEDSYFAFETIDRRQNSVVLTGILRTSEPDRSRVGRFWVELTSKDGKWIPSVVQTKTQSDSNAEQLTWP